MRTILAILLIALAAPVGATDRVRRNPGPVLMNGAGMDSTPNPGPLPPVRPANIDKGKKP